MPRRRLPAGVLLVALALTALAASVVYAAVNTTWTRQATDSKAVLHGVWFVDANHGWAVGDGAILVTSNGGTTWTHQTPPALPTGNTYNFNRVMFTDLNNGWIVGEPPDLNGTSNNGTATILHTSNGGSSWVSQDSHLTAVNSSDFRDLEGLFFLNSSSGWGVESRYPGSATATPNYGQIIDTTNGGAVWNSPKPISDKPLSGVSFVTATQGWVVGDSGRVMRTTNGATWSIVPSSTTTNLEAVRFIDGTHGWAVGDNGTIIRWNGTAWSNISPAVATGNNAVDLQDVSFVDALHGWAVGETSTDGPDTAAIIETSDGGNTWSRQDFNAAGLKGVAAVPCRVEAVGGTDSTISISSPTPTTIPTGADIFGAKISSTCPSPSPSATQSQAPVIIGLPKAGTGRGGGAPVAVLVILLILPAILGAATRVRRQR